MQKRNSAVLSDNNCGEEMIERRKSRSVKNFDLHSQINKIVAVQFPVNEISSVYSTDKDEVVLKKTMIVKCKVIFSRMGNINTKLERFDSQIFVECYWDDDSILKDIMKDLSGCNRNCSENDLYERVLDKLQLIDYSPKDYYDPNLYIGMRHYVTVLKAKYQLIDQITSH